jgi:hypothetical protein
VLHGRLVVIGVVRWPPLCQVSGLIRPNPADVSSDKQTDVVRQFQPRSQYPRPAMVAGWMAAFVARSSLGNVIHPGSEPAVDLDSRSDHARSDSTIGADPHTSRCSRHHFGANGISHGEPKPHHNCRFRSAKRC